MSILSTHLLVQRIAVLALGIVLLLMTACTTIEPNAEIAVKAAQPKGRVVLVHGIFDTRLTMRPLRNAIVDGGYECLVPSLRPIDGRKGLEPMAQQLKKLVDEKWGPDSEFSIVAFSMGGLISRYYLQNLGGAERCQGLYTLATPHNGTYMAYLYPGRGTKQMRPESDFLATLQKSEDVLKDIPITSYRSPLDVVMLPTNSPRWEAADNVRVWSAIHPSLMWEKELHTDLLKRLAKNVGP